MFKHNKNLAIVALIAVVNALGYGIIIPIIYTYSQQFGLSDFQNGLLFSTFSLAQFISAPLIGRLSDKYGRKPLLVISLIGTALSFLMMAFASSGWMLFAARILDGLTAGNIPVASAVISDTTAPKDRAKGSGLIGAAFGFGFVFGPAISAVTLRYGASAPFFIAAFVSVIAVLVTFFFLTETNTHEHEIAKGKLFDFKKLFTSISDEAVGATLTVSLLYSLAFSLYIYVFQPFAVKVLAMNPPMIALNFTGPGIVGLIAQGFLIRLLVKRYKDHTILLYSLYLMVATFTLMFFIRSIPAFIAVTMIHALSNSFINPIIQTLLSKEMDAKSQGSIMGLNASYISIGTIVGPILGGAIATISIEAPFLLAAFMIIVCIYFSYKISARHHTLQHAF